MKLLDAPISISESVTKSMSDYQGLDIRELAEIFNEENRDVYLSLYVDLSERTLEATIRRRTNAIKAAIKDKKMIKLFEESVDTAMKLIQGLDKKTVSAAAFINIEDEFSRVGALGANVETTMILDASPYILPLARFEDEYEEFLLVLIDGQHAEIHIIQEAIAERVSETSHSSIGRHKRGGWSQRRYQRIREGVVQKFYDQTAEHVEECIDGEEMRIIVAGPGPTKLHFIERLSKRAKEQVIAVEDIDFDAQNEIDIIRRFIKLAKKDEGEKEIHYIEKLRKEMMSGNLAALGVYEVLDAAASGRIQSVLILEGYQQAGMKCEPCQFYMKKQKEKCGKCGSDGNEVELVNETAEAAIRINSHVEFISDPFLKDIGGVAAILRW